MKDILARNILLLGALDELAAAAGGKGLKFLLLKGAALLAEGVYGPGERQMTDIDVLIRPADEKAFDALLKGLGFAHLEGSSQAYSRPSALSPQPSSFSLAPPVLIDLHTGLWHEKSADALWHRSERYSDRMPAPALGPEDQFLHLASHALLYHGRLEPRTLEDLARLLKFIYARKRRTDLWRQACDIASGEGLEPALYPVLARLAAAHPEAVSAKELALFEPRGAGRLKRLFFEKAAERHSRLLEYALPAIHRPELFVKYLFPGGAFLERRYGKSSWLNPLRRPFQLLRAILRKED